MDEYDSGSWKPPPIPDDDALRLEVLRAYAVLDTPPEEAFEELTALAAHICEAPICMINLVDEDRQWVKSRVGIDTVETPRIHSFCAHAINQSDAFVVPDTHLDERFRGHPSVTADPHIRFYAGEPLVSPEGQPLGTLCVIDREPRELKPDHQLALRVLGRHVMALLELRRRNREMARTGELNASLQELRGELEIRQAAEQAIARERDLADQVINSLPGVFYLIDREGRFLRWNRNLEVSTGYSADEVEYLHALDLFEGPDRELVARRIEAVFESGESEVEADMVSKDGHAAPYYLTGRRIELDGRPCLIGMGVDVTLRKQAEAERDRLFELSPDLFCIAGFDGYFKQLNPAWEATLGYSRDELLARPYTDFVHPDDQGATLVEARRAQTGRLIHTFENRYRHRDGSWRWFSWNSTPATDEELIYAVARDVTDSREMADALARSEEGYRSLVEGAQDGIFVVSPEGVITSLNPAFETLTGRSRREWVGKRFEPLVHPDDVPRTLETFEAALEGEYGSAFELRLLAEDGSPVPMELTLTAQQVDDQVVALLGIARDIRARLRLEEQLRRIQKLDSIGRLAAGIAHDFNNLLTVQQASVSLLQMDDELPEHVNEELEEIAGATDRAAALTRQLLLFSRKQAFEMRPVDLNEAIEGLSRILRRVLGEDLSLELDIAGELPLVRADAGMVEQVLLNLAVNARDAMSEGGRLTIRSSTTFLDSTRARENPEARPGTFVLLDVTDTGTGISPEVRKHMFEPFFTTKDVGEGTGLGLATAHGIVQQHRGWIEVDSRVGEGTTFRILLPVAEGDAVESSSAPRLPEIPGGDETILVVEDDPPVARIVRTSLERHGYRVLMAVDGVDALDVWNERGASVDLLLTDMVMPRGVTGRELADRLRRERRGLKVLFTSGYSPDRLPTDPALESATSFLQKPYTVRTLLRAVRDRLDMNP